MCPIHNIWTNSLSKHQSKGAFVTTNLNGMLSDRLGNPEERYLLLRLRTSSSHWANRYAGPAVISPNIYSTCKTSMVHPSFNYPIPQTSKKKQLTMKLTREVTVRGNGASGSSDPRSKSFSSSLCIYITSHLYKISISHTNRENPDLYNSIHTHTATAVKLKARND